MGDIEVEVPGIDKMVKSAYELEKDYRKACVLDIIPAFMWVAVCIIWIIKTIGSAKVLPWIWGVLLLYWLYSLISNAVKAVKSGRVIRKYKEYFKRQQAMRNRL